MAYWGEIELIQNWQDIANNISNVTAKCYAVSDSGSAWKNDETYARITLDGTSEDSNVGAYNFKNNKKLLLGSITKNVTHNTDGTKTVDASFSWNAGHSYIGTVTANNSLVLSNIPRYADFTEHYVVDTGLNTIAIKWNANASCDYVQYSLDGGAWTDTSGLYYTISNLSPGTKYSIKTRIRRTDSQLWTESSVIYGTTKKIATVTGANNFNSNENPYMTFTNESGSIINVSLSFEGEYIVRHGISNTGSYTFELTEAERNLLYSKCPNSNILNVRYIIATYVDGEEKYWSVADRVMTVVDSNPIFSNFSFKDIGEVSTKLTGNNQIVINGYNVMEITVSSANKAIARNGATIDEYRAVCGNIDNKTNYSENSDISLTLDYIKNRTIIVYAIDSRGNSTAVIKTIENWKEYNDIIIKTASIARTRGVSSETRLTIEGEIWNNNFGAIQNKITDCTYKYKKTNETEYVDSNMQVTTIIKENKFTANVLIKGDLGTDGFDVQNSYNILITTKDKLKTSTFSLILGTGIPAMAIHKNGVAFGEPYNEEVGGHLQLDGKKVIVNDIAYCQMSVKNMTTAYPNSKIVDHFGLPVSYGGFIADIENSRLEIPVGTKTIEVSGLLCGYGYCAATILINDSDGNRADYYYQSLGILTQFAGNGYWKCPFPSKIIRLDGTKKYYISLEVGGYNGQNFELNNGYGEYASWIQAKKIN